LRFAAKKWKEKPMQQPWIVNVPKFKRETASLSTAEHGAFILLLCRYWSDRGLPDDDQALAGIVGIEPKLWQQMRPAMEGLFEPGWRYPPMDEQLAGDWDWEDRLIALNATADSARDS
jgi:uncharacterized protein YdaU (DUF1376 family)